MNAGSSVHNNIFKAHDNTLDAFSYLSIRSPKMGEARKRVASAMNLLEKSESILSDRIVGTIDKELRNPDSLESIMLLREFRGEFYWFFEEIHVIRHRFYNLLVKIDKGVDAELIYTELTALSAMLDICLKNFDRLLHGVGKSSPE